MSVEADVAGREEEEASRSPGPVVHLPRFALLFPGQGAQRPGMAARLLEISRAARAVFEEADRALGFRVTRIDEPSNEEKGW